MNKKIHLFGKTIKVSHILLTIIMFGIAFLMIAPFLWVLSASFRTYSEATSLPPKWLPPFFTEMRLGYFKKLFSNTIPFFVFMKNSLKISVIITLGMSLHGAIAGYAYAKFDFPGKKGLFTLYIALMMMPFQVMLLGNYLVLDDLRLLDSLLGIILPAVFSTFPVFIMYRFFEGIPLALLEAARLDGAGELRLFFMIAIPLGSPGVISAMVLGFLEYWNLIEQPMVFLKTKELWPLSLYLPNIDMDHAGTAFAASMVALIPAVLVFFAGQDYLEQGIVSTAVKE